MEESELDAAQGREGKRDAGDDENDSEPVVANESRERLVKDPDEDPKRERDDQVRHKGDVCAAIEMVFVLKLMLNKVFLKAGVGEHVGEARHHRDSRDNPESLRH